ncbi:Protein of unknown function [Gryllus bimaculatus]|nr:Protein of unknown function [Gryllus bimaculatus]
MSFNTEWDIDKYKTEYESEEHWQLRRCFMETHKNKFPEERLVCLAQVFTNIEFMGCRYPAETMQLVGQLSQGVADGYREKQKTKLQRTFVKASDAAGAKVKGLKRPLGDAADPSDSPPKISKGTDRIELPQKNISSTSDISKCPGNIQLPETAVSSTSETLEGVENVQLLQKTYSSTTATPQCSETKQLPRKTTSTKTRAVGDTNIKSTSSASQFLKKRAFVRAAESSIKEGTDRQENNATEKNGCEENSSEDDWRLIKKAQSNRRKLKNAISNVDKAFQRCYKDLSGDLSQMQTRPYGNLFLFEDINCPHPFQVLAFSTSQCRIPFRMEYSAELTSTCCKILVNGLVVVSVSGPSKKIAREVAVRCALEKLKDVCYTLKVKKERIPEDLVIEMATLTSVGQSAPRESRLIPLPKAAALATPLPEDNIGSKLMRSMGWTGGGLGKAEQGIQEPVSVSLKVNRAGLGAQDQKKKVESNFKAKVQLYLAQYLKLDFPPNLIFKSNEFSIAEKGLIQQVAKVMGLECTNIGNGDEVHLKISRKDTINIIAALMLRRGEYSDEYYELLPPRNPSTQHHEPECLQASDFPHLCRQESSDTIYQKYVDGYNVLESEVVFGDLGGFLVKNITKGVKSISKRKRGRRKDKFARRAARRSERVVEKQFVPKRSSPKPYALDAIAAGPYGNFFLVECKGENLDKVAIIHRSAKNNYVPVTYRYGWFANGAVCKVFVNNHLLTSACDFTRKGAHKLAVEDAYDKLKQICYVLKINDGIDPDDHVIDRNELKKFESEPTQANSLEKPLQENIGSKLMRGVGLTRGDLAMEHQGIHEPVRPSVQVEKASVGLQDKKLHKVNGIDKFKKQMSNLLSEYKTKNEPYGLTFSSEFTREERKITHQLCLKLKLKSKSYGEGEERQLVVSHKDYNEVVEEMLRSGEYSNSKYQLIKPPIALPPENKNEAQTSCENNVKCEDAIVSPVEPTAQVPEDQPPLAVADLPRENISPVIVKPVDTAVQNVVDGDLWRRTDGITGPFGSLVLIEDETVVTPIQLIERSANGCHIPFKFEYGNAGKGGMLLINNILVASSTEVSKKRAREVTVSRSLLKLKDVCCTVKTQIKMVDGSISIIKCLKKPNKRSVGYGKDSEKHIVVSKEVDWPSLGMENGVKALSLVTFKDKVRKFLRKYQADSCPYDLIFSPEFSAHEKSWIQKIASGLALKITKYDVSMKEYMVINKKLSSIELAKAILTSGGNKVFIAMFREWYFKNIS